MIIIIITMNNLEDIDGMKIENVTQILSCPLLINTGEENRLILRRGELVKISGTGCFIFLNFSDDRLFNKTD